MDEEISDSSVLGHDEENLELDATFILEDTRLKLVE